MVRCGPKLSIFGVVIGIWGVVMLSFLGLFFRLHSPALAMDLPPISEKEAEEMTNAELKEAVYANFRQTSNNCFIAAGIYILVGIASAVNYKVINVKGTTATS